MLINVPFGLDLVAVLVSYTPGQRVKRGGVLGKQAESFNIEGESRRGIIQPQAEVLPGGKEMIAGIYLGYSEAPAIILQPLRRRFNLRGIITALDERPVRRRRNPDKYLSHTLQHAVLFSSEIFTHCHHFSVLNSVRIRWLACVKMLKSCPKVKVNSLSRPTH